jgi:hypothetical protein
VVLDGHAERFGAMGHFLFITLVFFLFISV